jgi:hypothetical protein
LVQVRLTHIEGEAAVEDLDQIVLVPGSKINQVYDVPGVVLGVSASAISDAPTNVDVYIWGFRAGQGVPPSHPEVPTKTKGTLTVQAVLDDGTGGPGSSAGPGVEVRLDGVVMGTTDADGSLTLERTAGEYSLEAIHPDGATGSIVVTIAGGETTDVTVILSQP